MVNNNNGDNEKVIILEDEKDKLLAHDYDGIKELDHPLPRWWSISFILCIVFSVIYFFYYHINPGPSLSQDYQASVQEAANVHSGSATSDFSETEYKSIANEEGIESGKATFTVSCVACHSTGGKGNIGPNLTDNFWISGRGTNADVFKIIHDGVPARGMPAWGEPLGKQKIYEVLAYVQSLKGSNPEGAKAPQGEEIK